MSLGGGTSSGDHFEAQRLVDLISGQVVELGELFAADARAVLLGDHISAHTSDGWLPKCALGIHPDVWSSFLWSERYHRSILVSSRRCEALGANIEDGLPAADDNEVKFASESDLVLYATYEFAAGDIKQGPSCRQRIRTKLLTQPLDRWSQPLQ
jgi:hypothetical protein